ncbi:hypothetical protein [Bradyrhizobium sp. 21]|nr:hypothetical protein [Bradyrhizobium sp. 21]MCK1387632.1 hypothetical protein [Bradyrhizobium sp. 21]
MQPGFAGLVEVSPGGLKLLAAMPTTIGHLESHQMLASARERPPSHF